MSFNLLFIMRWNSIVKAKYINKSTLVLLYNYLLVVNLLTNIELIQEIISIISAFQSLIYNLQ